MPAGGHGRRWWRRLNAGRRARARRHRLRGRSPPSASRSTTRAGAVSSTGPTPSSATTSTTATGRTPTGTTSATGRARAARAGTPSTWARWHVVVLNSECDGGRLRPRRRAGAVAGRRPHRRARRAARSPAFHRPRFSSGDEYGDDESCRRPVAGAAGRRASTSCSTGTSTATSGSPRSATRGGRRPRRAWRSSSSAPVAATCAGSATPKPNSEVRWNDSFGVLALTLRADRYDWRFHGTPGRRRRRLGQRAPAAEPREQPGGPDG